MSHKISLNDNQIADFKKKISKTDLTSDLEEALSIFNNVSESGDESLLHEVRRKTGSFISRLEQEASMNENQQVLLEIRSRLSTIRSSQKFLKSSASHKLTQIINRINKKCLGEDTKNATRQEADILMDIDHLLQKMGFNINSPGFNKLTKIFSDEEKTDTTRTPDFKKELEKRKTEFIKRINQYLTAELEDEEAGLHLVQGVVDLVCASFADDILYPKVKALLKNKTKGIGIENRIKEFDRIYHAFDLEGFNQWYKDVHPSLPRLAKEKVKAKVNILSELQNILSKLQNELNELSTFLTNRDFSQCLSLLQDLLSSEPFGQLTSTQKKELINYIEGKMETGGLTNIVKLWLGQERAKALKDLEAFYDLRGRFDQLMKTNDFCRYLDSKSIDRAFKEISDAVCHHFKNRLDEFVRSPEKIFNIDTVLPGNKSREVLPAGEILNYFNLSEVLQLMRDEEVEALRIFLNTSLDYNTFSRFLKQFEHLNPLIHPILLLCDCTIDYPNNIENNMNSLDRLSLKAERLKDYHSNILLLYRKLWLQELLCDGEIERVKYFIYGKEGYDDINFLVENIETVLKDVADKDLFKHLLDLKKILQRIWLGKQSLTIQIQEAVQRKISQLIKIVEDQQMPGAIRKGKPGAYQNILESINQLIDKRPFWEEFNEQIETLKKRLDHFRPLPVFYEVLHSGEILKADKILKDKYDSISSATEMEIIQAYMALAVKEKETTGQISDPENAIMKAVIEYAPRADSVGLLKIECEEMLLRSDYESISKIASRLAMIENFDKKVSNRLRLLAALYEKKIKEGLEIVSTKSGPKKEYKKDVIGYIAYLEAKGEIKPAIEVFSAFKKRLKIDEHEIGSVIKSIRRTAHELNNWNDLVERGLEIYEVNDIETELDTINSRRNSIEGFKDFFDDAQLFNPQEIERYRQNSRDFIGLYGFIIKILNRLNEIVPNKNWEDLKNLYDDYEAVSTPYSRFPVVEKLKRHIINLKSSYDRANVVVKMWQRLITGDFDSVESGKDLFHEWVNLMEKYLKQNNPDQYNILDSLGIGTNAAETVQKIEHMTKDLQDYLSFLSSLTMYKNEIINYDDHPNNVNDIILSSIKHYKEYLAEDNSDSISRFYLAFFKVKFRKNAVLKQSVFKIVNKIEEDEIV